MADAGTYKEIENTIGAIDRLEAAIVEFKKKRTDAEAELANSRERSRGRALERRDGDRELNAHKAKDGALAAKIASAEELKLIIQAMIDELKANQSEALKVVLQRELEQLEAEVAAEEDKEELLKKKIDAIKALLDEIEDRRHPPAARKNSSAPTAKTPRSTRTSRQSETVAAGRSPSGGLAASLSSAPHQTTPGAECAPDGGKNPNLPQQLQAPRSFNCLVHQLHENHSAGGVAEHVH